MTSLSDCRKEACQQRSFGGRRGGGGGRRRWGGFESSRRQKYGQTEKTVNSNPDQILNNFCVSQADYHHNDQFDQLLHQENIVK